MKKALEFLKNHVEVAFATCENNRPKIRVFQIMKMDGTDLYFATSPVKGVYKQLQDNPYIEILSREGQISVRCVGKAVFDVDEETKMWIYEHNSVLSRLYSSYDKMGLFQNDYRANGLLRFGTYATRIETFRPCESYRRKRFCGRAVLDKKLPRTTVRRI